MKNLKTLLSLLLTGALLAPVLTVAAETGNVTISVRNMQPSSVPIGAQRVEFLRFTATASCERDVHIQEITVHHRGLGDSADIEGVSLWAGDRRISRSVAIDSSRSTATLRSRVITIPKCGSADFSVRGDLSPDATGGGEHFFSVTASDVESDSTVKLTTDSAPGLSASVTPAQTATVTVTILPVTTSVNYGANQKVAKFSVESAGTRAQALISITLTNGGSATDRDLQNLVLKDSRGSRISRVLPSLDGDTATFVLDPPLVFESHDERIITVSADMRASRRRTIRFSVEEASDVLAQICGRSCGR